MDYRRYFLMLCWLMTISLAQTNVSGNVSGNWSENRGLGDRLVNASYLSQGQLKHYLHDPRDGNHTALPTQIEPESNGSFTLEKKLPENHFINETGNIQSRVLYTSETRDDSLFLLFYTEQHWSGTDWINSNRSTITYDSNGNQIQHLFYEWNGIDWVIGAKYYYTYDINNNLLTNLRQVWEDTTWLNQTLLTYTYDAANNQLTHLIQQWSGGIWVNSSFSTRTYDVNNNLILMIGQHWTGSVWINSWQYTLTYDANNNRLSELHQDWDGSGWTNDSQLLYTYDSNDNRLSVLFQNWGGTEWMNDYQNQYTYDSNNNCTLLLSQNWLDSTWVNGSQTFYTYNENNDRSTMLRQNWNGTDWMNSDSRIYTYDSNYNLLTDLYQHWSGASWDYNHFWIFTYDSNNNCISREYQNGSGSSLVNFRQWFFTYNDNNDLLTELEQWWEGGDWVNHDFYSAFWGPLTPTINPIADQVINEDSVLVLSLSALAPLDGVSIEYSAFSSIPEVVASTDTSLLTLTPESNWNGLATITVIVTDENNDSDTTDFILFVLPVNDSPGEFFVQYPTLQDTFSTHPSSDSIITFTWHPSLDVDNDITYHLILELEFFGNYYTDDYENISDTTFGIQSNSLDVLLSALSLQEAELSWFVETTDGEYTVISDTGQFVLTRAMLGTVDDLAIPKAFSLHQNFPNPFNPTTTIRYDLPKDAYVRINLYDLMGRQIINLVNNNVTAGYQSTIWNGLDTNGEQVSSGTYIYKIQAGDFIQAKKMVLIK